MKSPFLSGGHLKPFGVLRLLLLFISYIEKLKCQGELSAAVTK